MSEQFVLTNAEYSEGVVISEYKGQFQLIAAKQGKDKIYQKWGEIEIGKDKTKRLPVSVNLGSDPISTLDAIKQVILGGKEVPF